jgi:hypothetical protein
VFRVEGEPALSPAESGAYLVARGAVRAPVRRRRRMVRVAPPDPEGPAPLARIVGHVPSFRGARREAPAAPRAVEPARAPARSSRLRRGALLALTGAIGACVATAWVPWSPPPVADAGVAAAEPPAPRPGRLAVEALQIETLDDAGAVLVHGQVANDTTTAWAGVRVETTLKVNGQPVRQRVIGCCDELTRAQALATLVDPNSPQFHGSRPGAAVIEAGDLRTFSVVFPSLGRRVLAKDLEVEMRILDSTAIEPPGSL